MSDDRLDLDEEARRVLGKGTQRLADHAKRIEGKIDDIKARITGNVMSLESQQVVWLAEEVKQLAICIRAIAEFFS